MPAPSLLYGLSALFGAQALPSARKKYSTFACWRSRGLFGFIQPSAKREDWFWGVGRAEGATRGAKSLYMH